MAAKWIFKAQSTVATFEVENWTQHSDGSWWGGMLLIFKPVKKSKAFCCPILKQGKKWALSFVGVLTSGNCMIMKLYNYYNVEEMILHFLK